MELHPENCREILALLSDYVDSDLPQADCAEIERHLAGCAVCREFLIGLAKQYRAVSRICARRVAGSFERRGAGSVGERVAEDAGGKKQGRKTPIEESNIPE